jgi:DNA-binding NarL/FixJ family response regulator
VIGGAPGVGKSRLARQVLDDGAAAGVFVARARATRSSVGIPLGAFSAYVPAGVQPANDAGHIQGVIAGLRAQAGDRELIVGVDDAQLLDPASATLLLHFAEHAIASVVATVRAGEPCPDAVTALWKDAGCIFLELEPLADEQLAELIETVLDGPLQHDARQWIVQHGNGNVLYARQLVAHALETEALALVDGLWRLARKPSASYSLRDLIAARMGELSGGERSGLELLTLAEPLPFNEAIALIGSDTLADLETKQLIRVHHDDGREAEVRIAQPLYGELIAAEIPAARGRTHRTRLAELVNARPDRSPADRVRVALWLADAGEQVPVEILLDAARAAKVAGLDTGGRLARQALDAGAGAEASMLLALSHMVRNRPEEAAQVLARAEGTIEDRRLAGEYLRERATVLQWGLGRTADTIALFDRALTWWPDEPWHQQVTLLRLPFVALRDPPGAHVEQLEQLLAATALPEDARRWLRRALAADRFSAGRTRDALALLPEIPEIPFRGELEFLEFAWIGGVGLATGAALQRLERDMRDAFYRAADAPDPAVAALAAVIVAATAYLTGRFLDCRRWLAEAISESERQDPIGARIIARALQAGVSLSVGENHRASVVARDLEAEVTSAHLAQPSIAAWIARGRAWGLLANARPPEAQALLLDAAGAAVQTPVFDAELRYEAMRAGRPARELAPALQELATRSDAPLTSAYAQHAAARAVGDAHALLETAEAFVVLGVNHYASEAAAHASAAFAAEGRQDSARRAAARSRELQPAEQGAKPVSIEGVDREAIDLTPREAQLVELAARGLTNAEIAETLVLSSRTVETHIYRAMRKLGINDRRDFRLA